MKRNVKGALDMALSALKKDFAGRAAAVGLSALAAFSPLSASYADSAGKPAIQTAQQSTAGVVEVANTQEVQGWKAAEQARDYGRTGNVGILIYRGADAGEYTGEQIARIFEAAFAKKNVQARAFYDVNETGGTSITYALGRDSWGPFNTTQAISKIDMIAGEYNLMRLTGEVPKEGPLVAQQ